MVAPKPVSLTQVNAANYDSPYEPEPLLVVGPIPGGAGSGVQSIVAGTNVTVDDSDPQNPVVSATGGGGAGAVSSVNGKTGVVELDLEDVVGDQAIVTGVIGIADNADAPTQATIVQPSDVTVRDFNTGNATSVSPGEVYFTKGANRGAIQAPSSGGTATVLTIPPTSGTIALAADVDNTYEIATQAQALAVDAVPKTRTVAGKPLSANITLDKIDVGLASVDNTSDANKPVSTAQQTVLNGKVNALNGVTGLWLGTQAQYNALTPVATVVYVIQG